MITGVNLIKLFAKLGISEHNKVKSQAIVPKWINKNQAFAIACLRDLRDTDGCVYFHHHKSNHGKEYVNIGLTFFQSLASIS